MGEFTKGPSGDGLTEGAALSCGYCHFLGLESFTEPSLILGEG